MYTPAHAYTHIHTCLRTYIQSITTRAHTRIHTNTQTHTHTHTLLNTKCTLRSALILKPFLRRWCVSLLCKKNTNDCVALGIAWGAPWTHLRSLISIKLQPSQLPWRGVGWLAGWLDGWLAGWLAGWVLSG